MNDVTDRALRSEGAGRKCDLEGRREKAEGNQVDGQREVGGGTRVSMAELVASSPNPQTYIEQAIEAIMHDRERILEGFIAETGCLPSEVEQVTEIYPNGMVWRVRLRAKAKE